MPKHSKIFNDLEKGPIFLSIFFCIIGSGCKKFVTVNPPASSISASVVYANNSSAAAVMSGIYSNMFTGDMSNGLGSFSILEGLSADELSLYSNSAPLSEFYQNALSSASAGASNNYFWGEIYREIHVANTVIEGVANSSGVSASMKQQLDGEAKFIRAFFYFYATNIYGDVPLVTSGDYLANNVANRTPKLQVYQQIIQDLKDAKAELSTNFVDANGISTIERARPNKVAAQALLARVYLYYGNLSNDASSFVNAKAEADSVIDNPAYNFSPLSGAGSVFTRNSTETIWQLAPTVPGFNTMDAQYFVLTAPPSYVALSPNFTPAFEPNDDRFENWVGIYSLDNVDTFYFPYKYKAYNYGDPVTEYLMVMRLAEQYLIRAEVKAQLDDISGAQYDLNAVRARAGLPPTSATDKSSLLTAILHERRIELFTEWGHRWFDLIRTGNINSVMGSPENVCQSKGGTWDPNKMLAPLPLSEIRANSNLIQNTGY